jgi:hypothetical protein
VDIFSTVNMKETIFAMSSLWPCVCTSLYHTNAEWFEGFTVICGISEVYIGQVP